MNPVKPVVLHTGNSLTMKEKSKRQASEEAFMVGRLHLVPPDELSERAKLKFEQIVAEAFWLDELSVDLLAAYCHAWDRWLTLVEEMNGQHDVIIGVNKEGKQTIRGNPNRTALLQYVVTMQQLSGKLGLGNIDRLRLVGEPPAKEKENDFAEFMAEVE